MSNAIGIIGFGSIGKKYYNLIEDGDIKGAEIGAVCRDDFMHYSDLLEANYCDMIIVSTPHASHYEIGLASLELGYPTLIEKPMSMNKQEYQELIDAGAVTSFSTRYAGKLKAKNHIYWSVNWYRDEGYYKGWRGEYDHIMWNQAIHNLDILQWSFGNPIVTFSEQDKYNILCKLTFPNGITCEYHASTNKKQLQSTLITDGIKQPSPTRTPDHKQLLQDFVDKKLNSPTIDIVNLIEQL